ncbi:PfkB family carbohydrate kinase [Marinilabilia sp.]|uniref:PfkB family carbohydrate kinase n=1 Tax=Marinilabilia sp. TaxID=2021252 RepID=UPI0025C2CA39|nr:PfkB family carbohydrate kinase [Marinilabilia sp.]
MGRIFGLGETVLDIIFKDNKPVATRPGGSAFNALVSLARAGQEVALISEIGRDMVGEQIMGFLKENQVDTSWLHRFSTGKTPVALAFLDENNNASYQVYKDFPDERFQIVGPEFGPGDILLFGSFFAVNPVLRKQVVPLLQKAREQGAFLIYDPNFRKNHLNNKDIYLPLIEENFSLAHLVRGSDEDFRNIFPGLDIDEVLLKIQDFDAFGLITSNSDGVYGLIDGHRFHVAARQIKTISTIGAGDNFNAGLAYGFNEQKPGSGDVERWKTIVEKAVEFSTNVCLSFDNYISREFAATLMTKRKEPPIS